MSLSLALHQNALRFTRSKDHSVFTQEQLFLTHTHTYTRHAMVKNSSVEEDYQDVVEAAAQVFINSFLTMDNPVRQTRIEAKELNRQWKNLIRE